MGAACTKDVHVGDTEGTNGKKPYVPPAAIASIAGQGVDRQNAWYQYALYCVTRLMDHYKVFMFPEIAMSLGSFREDIADYLDVVSELYHDLCFDERLLVNGRVTAESDRLAKEAVSLLAFAYWRLSATPGGDVTDALIQKDNEQRKDVITDMRAIFTTSNLAIQADESYKYIYEDTLKLLITDLERKEIWQLSTLFSNEAFQQYLKEVEPKTYEELSNDSIMIMVPRPLKAKQTNTHSDTNSLAGGD